MSTMGWFEVVRGHPRSPAMSPFDRACMISYSSLLEILLYLVPFPRCTDIASNLSTFDNFDLSHLHLPPALGVTPLKFQKRF